MSFTATKLARAALDTLKRHKLFTVTVVLFALAGIILLTRTADTGTTGNASHLSRPSTLAAHDQKTKSSGQSEQAPANKTNPSKDNRPQSKPPTPPTAPGAVQNTPKTNKTPTPSTALPVATVQPVPAPTGNPRISAAYFAGAQIRCEFGIKYASISDLQLRATYIPSSGLPITWKWETSLPSWTHDISTSTNTATLPHSNYTHAYLIGSAGYNLYHLSQSSAMSLGGTIPAHSVRIHILSPNDIYTSWFDIPQMTSIDPPCS